MTSVEDFRCDRNGVADDDGVDIARCEREMAVALNASKRRP